MTDTVYYKPSISQQEKDEHIPYGINRRELDDAASTIATVFITRELQGKDTIETKLKPTTP